MSTILTKYLRRRRFTIHLLAVQFDSDARITPLQMATSTSLVTCCYLEFFWRPNDNAITTEVFCMTHSVAAYTQCSTYKLFIRNLNRIFAGLLLRLLFFPQSLTNIDFQSISQKPFCVQRASRCRIKRCFFLFTHKTTLFCQTKVVLAKTITRA